MRHEAVVIGSGPNGLVAANRLADAGWSVLVLEAQPTIGGAVQSSRDVHPDFVHDTFSSFYPLGAASPIIRDLHLEHHGLRWRHAPAVLGHPFPDGTWALQQRDRDLTAASFDVEAPGDGQAWLDLCALWDEIGDDLVAALTGPFPPVRRSLRLLPGLARSGGHAAVRTLLASSLAQGSSRFRGRAPRILLAGNAAHADIPLAGTGSGLMGLVLTMLGHTVGFAVPEGGAGELSGALAQRLRSRGGRIETGREVTSIDVVDRRLTGVRTADGERFATRTVIADVSAPALYGRLLDPRTLPSRVVRGMRRFQWDPATIKVDWALDGPVPWASEPAVRPGTVHIADSIEEMVASTGQVASGLLPERPFLLAGQMTTSDPTRSPAGTEALWSYTHVPQAGIWGRDESERYADLLQSRFESLAPGFGSRIIARRVLGPADLEARDANLVGGAIGGGTQRLRQQLVLRPVPGYGRSGTPVPGLFLASASAHPGGGVHGAPGHAAARAALLHARLGRRR